LGGSNTSGACAFDGRNPPPLSKASFISGVLYCS
jgi:hypothetical protein